MVADDGGWLAAVWHMACNSSGAPHLAAADSKCWHGSSCWVGGPGQAAWSTLLSKCQQLQSSCSNCRTAFAEQQLEQNYGQAELVPALRSQQHGQPQCCKDTAWQVQQQVAAGLCLQWFEVVLD
jgi:hypothetical protein